MSDETPVQIELTIALDMTASDVWPDGVPEQWTAADVAAEIEKSGSVRGFIDDWDADTFGAAVDVLAKGVSSRGKLR